MIALVRLVIALRMAAGSMQLVSVVAVHEHGRAAGDPDRLGGGEEGVGVGDHFVARAETQRHEGQPERIGAVADADGVLGAGVGSQLLLELLEHRALHVLAALKHFLHLGINLALDILVLPYVTVKRDFHAISPL